MTARPNSTIGPTFGSLCTGIGGLDLAVERVLGGRLVWVADPDRHITAVLESRAPGVPNYGDITDIDWSAVAPVDLLTAGFPCQDISACGKHAGIEKGTRSGLWYQVMEAVCELRPGLVFVENVVALRWRGGGLHIVLGDLARAGYDACWHSLRASDIGAAHRRERVFILAWPTDDGALADAAGKSRWDVRARPTTDRGDGSPGASGRRCARRDASAADTDGRRFPLVGDPDGAATGSSNARRMRDTDRCGAAVAGLSGRRFCDPPRAGAQGSPSVVATSNLGLTESRPFERVEPRVDWGEYGEAIARWEKATGRGAPHPAQMGARGRSVLDPRFVEWLMGYPDGWISDLDLPRTAQLHALGNAVVPAQAEYALRTLLADRRQAVGKEDAA